MNYESLTNKELMDIGEKKGIVITAAVRNELTTIRMVENDARGTQARQSFISRLQALDNQALSRRSFIVSILSLIIALTAIIISLIQ